MRRVPALAPFACTPRADDVFSTALCLEPVGFEAVGGDRQQVSSLKSGYKIGADNVCHLFSDTFLAWKKRRIKQTSGVIEPAERQLRTPATETQTGAVFATG
jgi:hypothetical protein